MLTIPLVSVVSVLLAGSLTEATPANLVARNNDKGSKGSKTACQAFRVSGIDNVVQAEDSIYYPAGAKINVTSLQSSLVASDLPAFCRVKLRVYTDPSAPDQYANTEVWLPDEYNGRFAGVGNGGLAGGVDYSALGYNAVYQGFASMGSDGGHSSDSGTGSWALDNPAAITDFGALRAIAQSTTVAKDVISKYYGKPPKKSYFIGCSTGGRQGLQLAQRFPDLYDGILAGAPAADWINLMVWEAHVRSLVTPVNGSSWIPGPTWDVIHKEILKQCDSAIDGVDDGVIENPNLCRFRPEVLSCRPGAKNTTACLNEDQLAAVKKIYADYYETNQTFIFSQYDYGAELGYSGLFGPQAFPIPEQYFRYFFANDSNFDINTLTYDMVLEAKKRDVGQLVSVNPDIREFAKRGGKLLQYHGLSDQLISSGSSIRYYNAVDAFTRMNTDSKVEDFYRYFPVPGMLHCQGGPGVNNVVSSQLDKGASYAPKTDFRAALVDWVENGKAPSQIIGTHYEVSAGGMAKGTFKRPLCKYPAQSKYKGKGNWKDASSWYCQSAPPNF